MVKTICQKWHKQSKLPPCRNWLIINYLMSDAHHRVKMGEKGVRKAARVVESKFWRGKCEHCSYAIFPKSDKSNISMRKSLKPFQGRLGDARAERNWLLEILFWGQIVTTGALPSSSSLARLFSTAGFQISATCICWFEDPSLRIVSGPKRKKRERMRNMEARASRVAQKNLEINVSRQFVLNYYPTL